MSNCLGKLFLYNTISTTFAIDSVQLALINVCQTPICWLTKIVSWVSISWFFPNSLLLIAIIVLYSKCSSTKEKFKLLFILRHPKNVNFFQNNRSFTILFVPLKSFSAKGIVTNLAWKITRSRQPFPFVSHGVSTYINIWLLSLWNFMLL